MRAETKSRHAHKVRDLEASVPQCNEVHMSREAAFNIFAWVVGAVLPIALAIVAFVLS